MRVHTTGAGPGSVPDRAHHGAAGRLPRAATVDHHGRRGDGHRVSVRAGADHPRRSGPGGRSTRRAGPATGPHVGRGGYLGDVPVRAGRAGLPPAVAPGRGRRHLHHPGVDDLVGDRRRRSGRGLEPAVRRTGRRRTGAADRPRASGPVLALATSSGTQTLRTRLVATDRGRRRSRRSVSAARSTAGRRCCDDRTNRPPWSPPTRRYRPGPVGSRSVSTGWPRSRCR